MNIPTLILFIVGLGLLIAGAELLVRGAARLAAAVGISALVIGLTVVAFGTSSPELAVSVQAALAGQADIAFGNVVGSNIFNILVIIGLSALITPLIVAQQLVRLDVPVMIGVTVLAALFAQNLNISRLEGIILFAGLVIYTIFLFVQSRREASAVVEQEYAQEFGERPRGPLQVALNLVFVVIGLGMLVIGSRWLVDGAVAIARVLGVSELVIGLTIVSAGTSLPEVATSLVAAIKGERDIAVGNAVGSNIFNLLSVLGLSSIAAPSGISVAPAALNFDVWVMLAVAIACLPVFFTGYRISRWEGAMFVGYYIAYVAYLILAATQHDALPAFSSAMLLFVIPLTLVTLAVTVFREFWLRKQQAATQA
ncbi:MAG: calcium/sodium antiporter [Thermoflexales bacterium]|nr:calcium/sodium antiporter [Thermoflexales bacterium]MDW8350828.1 calcium/sodium antiporter [Anaerolineae bacterium]